jgi:hypothetical protein
VPGFADFAAFPVLPGFVRLELKEWYPGSVLHSSPAAKILPVSGNSGSE